MESISLLSIIKVRKVAKSMTSSRTWECNFIVYVAKTLNLINLLISSTAGRQFAAVSSSSPSFFHSRPNISLDFSDPQDVSSYDQLFTMHELQIVLSNRKSTSPGHDRIG